MRLRDQVTSDTRYTFTSQFLRAAAIFIRRARAIESSASPQTEETIRCEHRGLVCSAIMQCAAALETETHEIAVHGPGAHLGSNGIDQAGLNLLSPIQEIIDDQSTMARFDLILHVLRKQPFDKGAEPYQSAALVVRLRNELVHYKSRWGKQMDSTRLYLSLQNLRHKPPPFTDPSMNFFPHRCLSADCGAWALVASVSFLEQVYAALGVQSRFINERLQLAL